MDEPHGSVSAEDMVANHVGEENTSGNREGGFDDPLDDSKGAAATKF